MILTPSHITASSWYRQGEPEWDAKCGPENLLREDGWSDFALHGWLSAVGAMDSVDGAWVQMEFERPVNVERIHVINGWAEEPDIKNHWLHGQAQRIVGYADPEWGSWELPCGNVPFVLHVPERCSPTWQIKLVIDIAYSARFNVVGLGRLRVEGEWA